MSVFFQAYFPGCYGLFSLLYVNGSELGVNRKKNVALKSKRVSRKTFPEFRLRRMSLKTPSNAVVSWVKSSII